MALSLQLSIIDKTRGNDGQAWIPSRSVPKRFFETKWPREQSGEREHVSFSFYSDFFLYFFVDFFFHLKEKILNIVVCIFAS